MLNSMLQSILPIFIVSALVIMAYRFISLSNEAKLGRILKEKEEYEAKKKEIDETINNTSLESLVSESNKRHGISGDGNP